VKGTNITTTKERVGFTAPIPVTLSFRRYLSARVVGGVVCVFIRVHTSTSGGGGGGMECTNAVWIECV